MKFLSTEPLAFALLNTAGIHILKDYNTIFERNICEKIMSRSILDQMRQIMSFVWVVSSASHCFLAASLQVDERGQRTDSDWHWHKPCQSCSPQPRPYHTSRHFILPASIAELRAQGDWSFLCLRSFIVRQSFLWWLIMTRTLSALFIPPQKLWIKTGVSCNLAIFITWLWSKFLVRGPHQHERTCLLLRNVV